MNPPRRYNSRGLLFFILRMMLLSRGGRCSITAAFLTTSSPRISTRTILLRTRMTTTNNHNNEDLLYASSGYKKPTVNWYPGHIAKAERQLAETLKAVDVVVEVRDARAPKATSHPHVGEWCAGRPRIVVLTHVDAIPKLAEKEWNRSFNTFGAAHWNAPLSLQVRNQATQAISEQSKYTSTTSNQQKKKNENAVHQVVFVNAKQGQGVLALQRSIFQAGQYVQQRRLRRGLKERPLRVGIMGFPNVGKSALINRLLGRRRAKTANTPGITKSLQWIRVKNMDKREFELLDSPGIIPASLTNQEDAALLAACNCIGSKAYDDQAIAAFFMEWCKTLYQMKKESATCPQWRDRCKERYSFDPLKQQEDETYLTGEDILFQVADNKCRGDLHDAARKILQDFRKGRLGPICLQLAPLSTEDDGQQAVSLHGNDVSKRAQEELEFERNTQRQERAMSALETAKQKGLELPPMVVVNTSGENDEKKNDDADTEQNNGDVGKGMFDGW